MAKTAKFLSKRSPGTRSKGRSPKVDPPIIVKSGAVKEDPPPLEMHCEKAMNTSVDDQNLEHPFLYFYPAANLPKIVAMKITIGGLTVFDDDVEKVQWEIAMWT